MLLQDMDVGKHGHTNLHEWHMQDIGSLFESMRAHLPILLSDNAERDIGVRPCSLDIRRSDHNL